MLHGYEWKEDLTFKNKFDSFYFMLPFLLEINNSGGIKYCNSTNNFFGGFVQAYCSILISNWKVAFILNFFVKRTFID